MLTGLEGEAGAVPCLISSLFHQLSLRLDRTRQLEMLTSAFKTETQRNHCSAISQPIREQIQGPGPKPGHHQAEPRGQAAESFTAWLPLL